MDIISHAVGFTIPILHSSLQRIFLEQCVSWEGEEYSQYLLCIFLVSTERKHPPSDSLSISMNQSALQSAFAEMHQHPHALNRKSFSTNNFKWVWTMKAWKSRISIVLHPATLGRIPLVASFPCFVLPDMMVIFFFHVWYNSHQHRFGSCRSQWTFQKLAFTQLQWR